MLLTHDMLINTHLCVLRQMLSEPFAAREAVDTYQEAVLSWKWLDIPVAYQTMVRLRYLPETGLIRQIAGLAVREQATEDLRKYAEAISRGDKQAFREAHSLAHTKHTILASQVTIVTAIPHQDDIGTITKAAMVAAYHKVYDSTGDAEAAEITYNKMLQTILDMIVEEIERN